MVQRLAPKQPPTICHLYNFHCSALKANSSFLQFENLIHIPIQGGIMGNSANNPPPSRWPLQIFSSDGKDIFSLLDRSSQEASGKALILIGDNSDHCELEEQFTGPNAWKLQFMSLLKIAESIDVNDWFKHQLENEWWLQPQEDDEFGENDPHEREEYWWLKDNWQEIMPEKIMEYREHKGEIYNPMEVILKKSKQFNYSIIPVEKAWMIPCYLNCGNINDQPHAVNMAALFKYWEEKYGAEFCLMDRNGDYGFRVARPPKTLEEAMIVAREHHIFCAYSLYDSNYGVNSMKDMANFLIDNHGWHFWFD